MKTFLNIIWYFPYFGFLLAIPMALCGLFWCITIVGLPLGLGMLQIAKFLLYPHTHALVSKKEVNALRGKEQSTAWRVFNTIVTILYFPVGLFVAATYLMVALLDFITIIGIPNGLVIVKMLGAVFNPVNKVCVPDYVSDHIQKSRDEQRLNQYIGTAPQPLDGRVPSTAPLTAPVTAPGGARPAAAPVRSYDDERLREIVANLMLYNENLVEQCRKELAVREHSAEVMPIAEGYSDEKLDEITYSPDEYSAELVYCAYIVLDRRRKAREEEAARKAAETERLRQEESERRKQEMLDFLNKWKFVIIGVVVAVIALSLTLWLTSDSHRFEVAAKAYENKDYAKALEYTNKISDPDSRYFDYANALGFNAMLLVKEPDEKTAERGRELEDRVERIMEQDDAARTHPFLTRYYCKTLYNLSTDSTTELSTIARLLENDMESRYTAGVAYFLDRQYDKAEAIFEDLAFEGRSDNAYAYMAVMNIFGLCSNSSREQGWNYLDNAPSIGMYGLLKGDKALRTGNSYKQSLKEADGYYKNVVPADIKPDPQLIYLRRRIVSSCLDNFSSYEYTFDSGSYTGQVKTTFSGSGANGWGRFKWKNGEVKYGRYEYKAPKIEDADVTINLGPASYTWESWLTDYTGSVENYVINYDGSFSTRAYYYPFDPEWYNLHDSYLDAIFNSYTREVYINDRTIKF